MKVVIVAAIILLFVSVYAIKSRHLITKESFDNDQVKRNVLLSPNDTVYVQGVLTLPSQSLLPMASDPDEDNDKPTVDGSKTAPKSLFMFAYNKCDMNCCDDSPYNCQNGCVCMSRAQKKYLSRGGRPKQYDD